MDEIQNAGKETKTTNFIKLNYKFYLQDINRLRALISTGMYIVVEK